MNAPLGSVINNDYQVYLVWAWATNSQRQVVLASVQKAVLFTRVGGSSVAPNSWRTHTLQRIGYAFGNICAREGMLWGYFCARGGIVVKALCQKGYGLGVPNVCQTVGFFRICTKVAIYGQFSGALCQM